MSRITFGILTVSDTCFSQEKQDTSGPKLEEQVKKEFPTSEIIYKKIVPDEQHTISETLISWADSNCNVILTTGGTGFSPRDVTPEATKSVIHKEAPGISYAMTSRSLEITDMAMLSRAVSGIRNNTLIINFPGSAKGAVECFGFVKSCISHAVALLNENKQHVMQTHLKLQGDLYSCNIGQRSKVKINNAAARNRISPYPMLEVPQALELVLHECTPTQDTELLPIDRSCHRILAEDIYAMNPIPPFPASIKDGYAVRFEDGAGDRTVRNISAAGDEPLQSPLKQNEVVRISTGAPVPSGANAVVQVEDTTLVETSPDGTQEKIIRINVEPKEGQDIRKIGSDISASSLVLRKQDRILAAHIGVLASLGKTTVLVFKRPSIGVLSTGNELKQPHEILKPGQIYDSNKLTLMNLLRQYSYESNDCGIAKDNPDMVKNAISRALSYNDILITTGGVSMGEFDIIKQVLIEDFSATIHFGRINMKPGKPTSFATLEYNNRKKLIFCLPGNPVSSCVTCILFVLPAVRYLENSEVFKFPVVKAYLVDGVRNKDPRPEYVRVSITYSNDKVLAKSTGNQISSRLNSLIGANGLLLLPGNIEDSSGDKCFDTILF